MKLPLCSPFSNFPSITSGVTFPTLSSGRLSSTRTALYDQNRHRRRRGGGDTKAGRSCRGPSSTLVSVLSFGARLLLVFGTLLSTGSLTTKVLRSPVGSLRKSRRRSGTRRLGSGTVRMSFCRVSKTLLLCLYFRGDETSPPLSVGGYFCGIPMTSFYTDCLLLCMGASLVKLSS